MFVCFSLCSCIKQLFLILWNMSEIDLCYAGRYDTIELRLIKVRVVNGIIIIIIILLWQLNFRYRKNIARKQIKNYVICYGYFIKLRVLKKRNYWHNPFIEDNYYKLIYITSQYFERIFKINHWKILYLWYLYYWVEWVFLVKGILNKKIYCLKHAA